MRVINKDEFYANKFTFLQKIDQGNVFIHPTDTIYGIGCNAQHADAVRRVREIKNRPSMPFSVIVPSVEWIREHCELTPEVERWLAKLPGPYTLVLKLRQDKIGAVSDEVNKGSGTLGVRIPKAWMANVAKELGKPIVTTSANQVGRRVMTSIDDCNHEVKHGVDFIIYEGEGNAKPSTVIDLTEDEPFVARH